MKERGPRVGRGNGVMGNRFIQQGVNYWDFVRKEGEKEQVAMRHMIVVVKRLTLLFDQANH
jgi:hypothetical protein